MILHTNYIQFREIAEKRGYAWADVEGCIVKHEVLPGVCAVDTEHPAYPHRRNGGPGTELKKTLAFIGIVPAKNCSCNAKAAYMDDNPRWAEENVETIVDWLAVEARKRRIPFLRSIGRMLVKRAIKRAKGVGR